MHWWGKGGRRWGLLAVGPAALVCWLAAAGSGSAQDAPIRNLRVPLEHHPDGRVKTQIVAETAIIGADGSIKATNIKVEMYNEDGQVAGMAQAGDCVVDRERGTVTSDSRVQFTQRGLSVAGMGFEWNAETRSFMIHDQARVVFVRDPQQTALWKRN